MNDLVACADLIRKPPYPVQPKRFHYPPPAETARSCSPWSITVLILPCSYQRRTPAVHESVGPYIGALVSSRQARRKHLNYHPYHFHPGQSGALAFERSGTSTGRCLERTQVDTGNWFFQQSWIASVRPLASIGIVDGVVKRDVPSGLCMKLLKGIRRRISLLIDGRPAPPAHRILQGEALHWPLNPAAAAAHDDHDCR